MYIRHSNKTLQTKIITLIVTLNYIIHLNFNYIIIIILLYRNIRYSIINKKNIKKM